MGPNKITINEFTFGLKPNPRTINNCENILTTMNKMVFYGHLRRKGPEQLTNKILNFQKKYHT